MIKNIFLITAFLLLSGCNSGTYRVIDKWYETPYQGTESTANVALGAGLSGKGNIVPMVGMVGGTKAVVKGGDLVVKVKYNSDGDFGALGDKICLTPKGFSLLQIGQIVTGEVLDEYEVPCR